MKMSVLVFFLLSIYFSPIKTDQNTKQNFCQNDRCITCIGRYCTTTCQGKDCSNCPVGDCCNGFNCNICRGEKCCSTAECNNCVITCLKECQGKTTCHYDCFQKCLPNEVANNDTSPNKNYGPKFIINRNYVPVNVTTIINITNTIENKNTVHNPVLVNVTNFNNYKQNVTSYHKKQVFIAQSNITGNVSNTKCCEVIHPEKCRTVNITTDDEPNGLVCFTQKHKECSEICIGKFVHIVEDNELEEQCIYISEAPHWYCGHFAFENCEKCHSCDDIDDPECRNEENCSDNCRKSLIPKEFYNKLYRKDDEDS